MQPNSPQNPQQPGPMGPLSPTASPIAGPVGPGPQPMSPMPPQPPVPAPGSPLGLPGQPAAPSEPRSFLAAFLLVSNLGMFGVHQIYLGRKTQGIVRLVLGIVGYLLMGVFVGFFILIPLLIWAIVDFFLVYLKHKDAEGRELVATNRDRTFAKVLFILTMVVTVLAVVAIFLLASAFGTFSELQNNALQQSQGVPQGQTFDTESLESL